MNITLWSGQDATLLIPEIVEFVEGEFTVAGLKMFPPTDDESSSSPETQNVWESELVLLSEKKINTYFLRVLKVSNLV